MVSTLLITLTFSIFIITICDNKVNVSLGNYNIDGLLYGIGNELLFQQLNNTQLNQLIQSTNSCIQRYPGGTPSDYWLWNIGWVNTSTFKTNLPELQALPIQWNKYLNQDGIRNTIIVINQLESNLSFQIKGLYAHQNASTSISYIELGNEMYDDTRSDVMKAYPNPSDYAKKMANWSQEIYNHFPNAQMALVGWGMSNISDNGYTSYREYIWNDQVLNNQSIMYPAGVTSATIHLYYPLSVVNVNNPTNAVILLQKAFENIRYDSEYWSKSISSKYKLLITEMGTYGNNNLLYTWIEALYMGVLELYIPLNSARIEIILPYCLVCGDPNMPAFIFNNITNKYEITAIGILETILVSEMNGVSKMTVLNWNNNNNFNDHLIGWKLEYKNNNNISKAIIINVDQYKYSATLLENILYPNCGINELKIKSIFTDSFDILIKQHSTMNDLLSNVTDIGDNNNFGIQPWSINLIYC